MKTEVKIYQLTVRIPLHLLNDLERIAIGSGQSLSKVVRDRLKEPRN
jgi:hypothetical protein